MGDLTHDDLARQNVEVVQRLYAAVGRGDLPALLDLLTDDVAWTLQGPPVIPFAGPRRGRAAVGAYFASAGATLDVLQFEPREFVAQGAAVVVVGDERIRIKATGRTFEQAWAHVYTLRDGQIARARFFEDTAAYVLAFAAR